MEEVIERSKNPNVKHVTKKGITYPGTRSRFMRSFTLIGTITAHDRLHLFFCAYNKPRSGVGHAFQSARET